ncbi:hypothetical protein VNO77_18250 [Canavalia gladiata]|uniref:Uncharacterized protein n=1 Tax=Canavalia gladiata TaxID=3824 RepID=A0AAN9LKG4_CANGL
MLLYSLLYLVFASAYEAFALIHELRIMEEERRKRKLENEEENEEQKMEKFFALIKRTKDVRDLLFKEKSDEGIKSEGGIWNPTFQPEDFIDCRELGKSNVSAPEHVAGPSKKEEEFIEKKECLQEATTVAPVAENNEDKEKEKASEHLDLNLSL